MIPLALSAVAQGVPELIKTGIGVAQYIGGRKMDMPRPKYEIPQGQLQALGQARSLASSQEMQGQSQAEQALNQQLALGGQLAMQTADSSASALGALQNMFANRMANQNSLAGQAESSYLNRQAAVTDQLANTAQYQQAKFAWDKQQPYLDTMAAKSANIGAGLQNMVGGLEGIGGAVAGYGMNKALLDSLGTQGTQGQTKSLGTSIIGATLTPEYNTGPTKTTDELIASLYAKRGLMKPNLLNIPKI